ncbi:MAG: tetratricopeptide repeat protein [Schleiferiaceae bacterium]
MRIRILAVLLMSASLYAQQPITGKQPEALFAEARARFDRALYSSAYEYFGQVRTMVPEASDWSEQSMYYQALCAIRLLHRDAEEFAEAFLQTYPSSSRRIDLILDAAEQAFNRRRYQEAKRWLRMLDGVDLARNLRAEVQFKLGYAHFLLNEFDQAKAELAEAKKSKSAVAKTAQYYYGHIAYLEKSDRTALDNLEPLQNHEEFGPVVPYYLAQIYARTGKDDELLTLGETLMKQASAKRAPEIALLIGQSMFRKKRYEDAKAYFEFNRAQGGKMSPEVAYQMGVCAYQTKDYEGAVSAFNQLPSEGSSDWALQSRLMLGDSYARLERWEEAQTAFRAVWQSKADDATREQAAYQYAKLTYRSASPFGDAIQVFNQFLREFPRTEHRREANEYLANLYLTSRDYGRALEAIVQTGMGSMAMREAYQKVAYFRAVELYQASQWAKAEELLDQSLSYPLDRGYEALAHFWKGEMAYRQGDYRTALSETELFLKTPGSFTLSERPAAQYNKAYALYRLDRLEDAAATFRVFLEDAPKTDRRREDAELRIADLYFLLGRHALARDYYGRIIKLGGTDADYASYQQALCRGLLGDNPGKIDQLAKLEKGGGARADEALFERAQTLLRMGRNRDAAEAFTAYQRKKPNTEKGRRAGLNIALAQRNDGDLSGAIATFQTVVRDYPGTPEAREAISVARSVYDEANRIDDYLEWVQGMPSSGIRASELDSVAYMSAYDKYAQGQNSAAFEALTKYLKRFPDGYFAPEANYQAAEAARLSGQMASALPYYRNVVRQSVGANTVPSYKWLLRDAEQRKDPNEIKRYAERLLALAEDASLRSEANRAMMRAHVAEGSGDVALTYAEGIIADLRQTPQDRSEALAVRLRITEAKYRNQPGDSTALGFWQQAAEGAIAEGSAEVQAEATYAKANILRLRNQFSASNEAVFALLDNFPGQQEWRYKALLVLARNYASLNDGFQARYTLDFVISEHPSDELVREAQALLAEFNAAQLESNAPQTTSDDDAE